MRLEGGVRNRVGVNTRWETPSGDEARIARSVNETGGSVFIATVLERFNPHSTTHKVRRDVISLKVSVSMVPMSFPCSRLFQRPNSGIGATNINQNSKSSGEGQGGGETRCVALSCTFGLSSWNRETNWRIGTGCNGKP